MITKTYNLDMHSGGVPIVVHLSQYDADYSLVFNLYSSVGTFTIESGTTATIRGTKSSGTGYSVDATLDVTNKRVTVTGDQQMTAAAGKQWFELTLTKNGKEINTANFILDVERAALDMDTLTDESVLRELEAIIQAAETATAAAEEAEESAESVSSYAETLAASIAQIITNTNDIAEIKTDIAQLIFTDDFKAALLACFEKVAWIDGSGQDLYDALEDAMSGVSLLSIHAVFNQGSHAIVPTDSLDSLKPYLTVTATYSDGTSETISAYTLSGTLAVGTSSILVSYLGRTALFTCTVTEPTLSSISCAYTQSGAVYTTDSLDSLKANLVVTATYSDSSTEIIPSADYTLSGTLSVGTSTITASYQGKTASFTVIVSAPVTLSSITATFTQGSAVIYDDDSLDDLKQYLVVTANYSDSTSRTVTDYTLSGTLSVGTSTITATYQGETDTFNVTVTQGTYIDAVFNPGTNIIYTDDNLATIKQYLTVTYYHDGTSTVLTNSDYTLSGSFAEGTQTFTATYNGMTDTFSVTVVDFYNNWTQTLSSGEFQKLVGSCDPNLNDTTMYPSRTFYKASVTARRTYVTLRGRRPYNAADQTAVDSQYYPIPVPLNANHVKITMTPAQWVYGNFLPYNPTNNCYENGVSATRITWTDLSNGLEHDFAKDANGRQYFLMLNSKYDSAGTSYPTEPTELILEFSEV